MNDLNQLPSLRPQKIELIVDLHPGQSFRLIFPFRHGRLPKAREIYDRGMRREGGGMALLYFDSAIRNSNSAFETSVRP